MAKLLIKHEGIVIKEFPIENKSMMLGRNSDNDIQLDDAAISGRHARITVEPNDYLEGHDDVYIEDLGSTNGTKVNGLPVKKHLLKNGDELLLGKHKLSYDSELDQRYDQTAIYIPDN